jgi:hypothetical protein
MQPSVTTPEGRGRRGMLAQPEKINGADEAASSLSRSRRLTHTGFFMFRFLLICRLSA